MSTKHYCDRCEREMPDVAHYEVAATPYTSAQSLVRSALCHVCAKALIEWLRPQREQPSMDVAAYKTALDAKDWEACYRMQQELHGLGHKCVHYWAYPVAGITTCTKCALSKAAR